ncbi:MAG: helix-hairpin-helix domain-containing protein [Phycisphaeraceae bacterium]|nr:helix-hairpin-helix domain-containing protein [Phycisphaeraceae bacterium]
MARLPIVTTAALILLLGTVVLYRQWHYEPTPDEPPRHLPSLRIDPRTATYDELRLLPGIGHETARRIILHRDEVGPISDEEGLARAGRIPASTLERIRPWLVFGDPPPPAEEPDAP